MIPRKIVTKVVFCIENESYKDYLKTHFRNSDEFFMDYEEFAFRVSEDPNGFLILQSDTYEYDMIEMCKKLKRLFSDHVKIILLSSDYQMNEYAHTIVDCFLQYPVSRLELMDAISKLSNKKRKILLIDDSKLVHKHICPPLEEEGYETFSAMDGQEDWKWLKKFFPI